MGNENYDKNKAEEFFNQSYEKAEEYASNSGKTEDLINQAQDITRNSNNNSFLSGVVDKLSTLYRLISAYVSGEYRVTPWRFILMAVTAILYLVSPLDALPDVIPVVGFADDAGIIAMVFTAIKPALDDFLLWERVKKQKKND